MHCSAYQMSFPCPGCGGILTMSFKHGEGVCPLCHTAITVNLEVQINHQESANTLRGPGWTNGNFGRAADPNKPLWKPGLQATA